MKIARFVSRQGPRLGLVSEEHVLDLQEASDGRLPARVEELLGSDEALSDARRLEESCREDAELTEHVSHPLEEVKLLSPVERPGKIACLGLNYRGHIEESAHDVPVPDEPVVFAKMPTSVIGPGDHIVLPSVSRKVDYEVELAVVIGKRGKDIPSARAMEHVGGYTVLNDVSARDYQHEKPGGQWLLAKSFDTFCPLGPWIVTPDEIDDPHNLELSCSVSGQVMQSSDTSRMLFRIPQIIEYISFVFTLEPGDVVATGTPGGVGAARTPPRFLRTGDEVVCSVSGVGTLRNPVR